MTKEITKAFILQQIEERFKLRDLIPEKFTFLESVMPTYNIEGHLKTWMTLSKTISVTGTGPKTIFSVPYTERRCLTGYTVVFMAAGAYTLAGVYIARKNDVSIFIYLDLGAAKTISYTVNLPKPLILDSGDKLALNVDGYTSTADVMVNCDYVAETIR